MKTTNLPRKQFMEFIQAFKFGLADGVDYAAMGISGVVISVGVGRGNVVGYWVEYATSTGEIREIYVTEDQLSAQ